MTVLLAPGKPGSAVPGLTPDQSRALDDAAGLLPYKTFQKLDAGFIRAGTPSPVQLLGLNGRAYSCVITANPTTPSDQRLLNTSVELRDSSTNDVLLNTVLRMELDETTVVGTSKLKSGDQALVLLLTAVSNQRRVYRIGEGIAAPRPLAKAWPRYTADAMKARVQGTVELECVVDIEGSATEIRITRSLEAGLDQEAITALQQWRFQAGTKDGQPVPVLVQITMDFSLRK